MQRASSGLPRFHSNITPISLEKYLFTVGRVAMKVRHPSRVRCAYHCKPLKVRTAYPTWYGFHLRGFKPICMNVRRLRRNPTNPAPTCWVTAQKDAPNPTYIR